MFTLTPPNYYSREANQLYLSSTQYKSFLSCEARALAELRGEYGQETSDAFLLGSYVHAWSDGTLEEFKNNHPELISSRGATKGGLKSTFKIADKMIETLENDEKAMFSLRGDKEVPVQGTIGGALWKGKLDVRNEKLNYILDLKTTKDINEFKWSKKLEKRVSFIELYDYFTQVAVYTELEHQHFKTEQWKDFYMLAVSKQDVPDHELIDITDHDRVRQELDIIASNVPHIVAVKNGEQEPHRCGVCDYCRSTKKIGKAVWYMDIKEN